MADEAPICLHCRQVIPRKKKSRGWDKRPLSLKLRRTNTTVYDVLKYVYLYKGPCTGHVCGNCFLHMEREHREIHGPIKHENSACGKTASKSSAVLSKRKRKERTPGSTPQKKKQRSTNSNFEPLAASTPRRPGRSLFPVEKVPTQKTTKPKPSTNIKDITESLAKSHYETAFRQILDRSPLAQKAFKEVVRKTIQKEMKAFLATDHQYMGLIEGIDKLQSFSWTQVMDDASRELPTLLSAIMGSMQTKNNGSTESKKSKLEQPRMGMMLSIPMYHHRPITYKLPQAACSAQMWSSGASEKLFKSLNHLGVCQSSSATRHLVKTLCSEPDHEMGKLKAQLEQDSSTPDPKGNDTLTLLMEGVLESDDEGSEYVPSDGDVSLDSDPDQEIVQPEPGALALPEAEAVSPPSPEPVKGFALVWDNIQKLSQVRDSYAGNKNEMLLWANAFAAVNRVEPEVESTSDQVLEAKYIPISAFLHDLDDADMLRERCFCIVSRILCKHMDHFKQNFSDVVQWHIPHEYQEEMSKKSKVINIGIIDENPSTRSGTIQIMLNLQKYIPRKADGRYRTVPTHGDGGSVERMNDAKKARAADVTDTSKLEGLEQTPQEFHHRGLMLQDTLDVLHKSTSIGDRCTLAQLKNEFDHTNVSNNAMQSYNAVENLLRFSTEAHIVYLAMRLLNLTMPHGVPSDSCPKGSAEERRNYLETTSKRIVEEIWLLPTCEQVEAVTDAETPEESSDWCFCEAEEEVDGLMVRCSNSACPLGGWFHSACFGLNADTMPTRGTDWWCSVDCRATGRSILCHCKTIREGPVVHCTAGEQCQHGEIFHLHCVHLQKVPVDPWHCSPECQGAQPDFKRNYAVTLTWKGLLDMVHRDAIREGDGKAMLMMWRVNMSRFWARNHYKYLIIGHRLLAGVNGWLEARLIEEIIHNRTCNLRGGPGHNIAMDRVNEFLNNQFKEILRHTHGQYSDDTIYRAGRMVGALAKAIDDVFSVHVAQTELDASYRTQHDYQADIERFVADYWEDNLFATIPGRQHQAFPGFNHEPKIANPEKLKQRFQRYSKRLDKLREATD